MYFTIVFHVMLCQDVGSADLKQILKFVIPHVRGERDNHYTTETCLVDKERNLLVYAS